MDRRDFLATGTAVGLSLLAGCGNDQPSEPEPTPTDSPTSTPESSPTSEPTPADCEPEVVSGDIEENTTWDTADCHRVALEGNVRVTGEATLTIEPGVEVIGQSGSRLTVRDEATLVASGDPENPVTFHGESEKPGYWQGIQITSDNPDNSLDNVDVAHGGGNDYANIYIGYADKGVASVTNSTLRQSATAGLVVERGAALSEFAKNEFRDNEGAAMYIPTNMVGAIDADSTYVDNNGTDAVRVSDQSVEEDATWPGVPYHFDGENHRIVGGEVTVDPGAQFTFGSGARITAKRGAGGSFAAEGTDDSPITFEGASATPGYWQGIQIASDNPNNSLDNVDVAHGGGNGYANIYVGYADSGTASVTNSTLRQSATWGIYVEDGATLDASGNTFKNNEKGDISTPETRG